MKTIDLDLEEIKANYRIQKPLIVEGINYYIGLVCGAIQEFRLYNKGKEYIVFNDKDITFIIIS
jgi:hypothetical protein